MSNTIIRVRRPAALVVGACALMTTLAGPAVADGGGADVDRHVTHMDLAPGVVMTADVHNVFHVVETGSGKETVHWSGKVELTLRVDGELRWTQTVRSTDRVTMDAGEEQLYRSTLRSSYEDVGVECTQVSRVQRVHGRTIAQFGEQVCTPITP